MTVNTKSIGVAYEDQNIVGADRILTDRELGYTATAQGCGGLGLALVRDLVIENSGTIEVTSTEQSGTTFRISLPTAG